MISDAEHKAMINKILKQNWEELKAIADDNPLAEEYLAKTFEDILEAFSKANIDLTAISTVTVLPYVVRIVVQQYSETAKLLDKRGSELKSIMDKMSETND